MSSEEKRKADVVGSLNETTKILQNISETLQRKNELRKIQIEGLISDARREEREKLDTAKSEMVSIFDKMINDSDKRTTLFETELKSAAIDSEEAIVAMKSEFGTAKSSLDAGLRSLTGGNFNQNDNVDDNTLENTTNENTFQKAKQAKEQLEACINTISNLNETVVEPALLKHSEENVPNYFKRRQELADAARSEKETVENNVAAIFQAAENDSNTLNSELANNRMSLEQRSISLQNNSDNLKPVEEYLAKYSTDLMEGLVLPEFDESKYGSMTNSPKKANGKSGAKLRGKSPRSQKSPRFAKNTPTGGNSVREVSPGPKGRQRVQEEARN